MFFGISKQNVFGVSIFGITVAATVEDRPVFFDGISETDGMILALSSEGPIVTITVSPGI
jgi:hypothetical protein